MIIIPAIDLKEGNCVRLEQGQMERDTMYNDDPADQARTWRDEGGELLHIVDLDGAFAGSPRNRAAIRAIVDAVDIPTEVGGGIRDLATIDSYLQLGVERVVLGSAVQKNPKLAERACKIFPGKIVVGIDARDGFVAIHGWQDVTTTRATELAKRLEGHGVTALIYTDIARDGMLMGPNFEAIRELAESVSIPVIASGGVSSLEDIRRLMALEPAGVTGVVVGKALYSGAVRLSEAVKLVKGQI